MYEKSRIEKRTFTSLNLGFFFDKIRALADRRFEMFWYRLFHYVNISFQKQYENLTTSEASRSPTSWEIFISERRYRKDIDSKKTGILADRSTLATLASVAKTFTYIIELDYAWNPHDLSVDFYGVSIVGKERLCLLF